MIFKCASDNSPTAPLIRNVADTNGDVGLDFSFLFLDHFVPFAGMGMVLEPMPTAYGQRQLK